MKISQVIETLQLIQRQFGDIEITGGTLTDEAPLRHITVTDTAGREIWSQNRGASNTQAPVDGVFLN